MLVTNSCKPPYAPPKAETCIGTHQGDLACDDPRLDEEDRSYHRPIFKGDMCTSPEDYEKYFNYCSNLRTKLIRCENRCDK